MQIFYLNLLNVNRNSELPTNNKNVKRFELFHTYNKIKQKNKAENTRKFHVNVLRLNQPALI